MVSPYEMRFKTLSLVAGLVENIGEAKERFFKMGDT